MTDAPSREASPKRPRRWLLEAGVVGVAYAGITSFQTSGLLDRGALAPEFSTIDVEGNSVALTEFSGRPLVLHFWATWCGVCRQEFSMLNSFDRDQGHLLALIAEEPSERIRDFVREHELRYRVAYAPASLTRSYRVSAYPTTYFLEQDHSVSSATIGMSTGLAMRARMMIAS
jgi:thiol-disulfide isomerase/thioredoxin